MIKNEETFRLDLRQWLAEHAERKPTAPKRAPRKAAPRPTRPAAPVTEELEPGAQPEETPTATLDSLDLDEPET